MTDATREAGSLARGTLRGTPFRLLRALLLPILGRLIGLRVEGLQHVPASGALLVVANHLHNADPILLSVAFPRPLHFMAKKELFTIPVVGWVIRRVGAFPVDRGKADRGAIRRAEATLAAGIAVGMFPEGTRSRTASMGRAHPGAALLALRADVPVLPVTIVGSERLPLNGTSVPRRGRSRRSDSRDRSIVIRIRPPFRIEDDAAGRRPSIADASERLMTRLAAGLPSAYRGIYAETETGSFGDTDADGLPGDTAPERRPPTGSLAGEKDGDGVTHLDATGASAR